MCTFITATINEGADLKVLEPIFAHRSAGFDVVPEPPIRHLLPKDRIYLVHRGPCDCGTPLGCGPTTYLANVSDKDLKKLQKRGWGEERIRRWQLAKAETLGRQKLRPPMRPTVDEWLELIREVLGAPTVTTFGLMHHFYTYNPTIEEFGVTLLPPKSIEDAEPGDLYNLRSDRLQEFVW